MEEYEALSFAAGVGFRGELGALSERETECAWGPDAKGEAVESDENEDGGGIEYEAFGTDALTEAGYEAVDTTDHFPVGLRGTWASLDSPGEIAMFGIASRACHIRHTFPHPHILYHVQG